MEEQPARIWSRFSPVHFKACVVSTVKYISTPKVSVEAKASTIGSSLFAMGISCDCGQTHLTKWLWRTPVFQTIWIIFNKQLYFTSLSCVNIPLFSFCKFWSMIAFLDKESIACMWEILRSSIIPNTYPDTSNIYVLNKFLCTIYSYVHTPALIIHMTSKGHKMDPHLCVSSYTDACATCRLS